MNIADEQTFKLNFISTFLATWCANEYEDSCMTGQHRRLEKPPVEDAEYLAEKAWEHYKEVLL